MSIDYLIRGGTVIDGSSGDAVPKRMDIAIQGDSIQDTGDLSNVRAAKTVDAEGLTVCPGFIDVHAHSEFVLLADGRGQGKYFQGITTEVNGNCGMSAAPLYGQACEQREKELQELNIKERWGSFSEYFSLLEKKGFTTNFITLTGHGNLRASVAGYADRPLKHTELQEMEALLRTSMEQGAKGLSTGLIYPPGIYSKTEEIIALAREIQKHNGIYTSHMRSEGEFLIESVDEAIEVAGESGVHVHISHLKTSGKNNWNKLDTVMQRIEEARSRGMNITFDRYPYTASSTDLDTVLPSWAFEGGRRKEIARLTSDRSKLSEEMVRICGQHGGWSSVVISSVTKSRNRWMEGKSISEIAGVQNKSAPDCVLDLLIDEDLQVGAIFFTMSEENLRTILKSEYSLVGTDSSARSFDGVTAKGVPHPRGFGTFPRLLGHYVRDLGLLTLSEAVYKMTGLPAKTFRIPLRGLIKKGFYADIAIFDAKRIRDTADYRNPFQKPGGIHHVFINGVPVLLDSGPAGALPGRILR